jgi:rhamnulokinase
MLERPMAARFLAFDLGAESGRAISARLDGGVLTLGRVARFPNEPVRVDESLRWNAPELWANMQRALDGCADTERPDSIGVDAWGCDFGLLDRAGALVELPYHYRDPRTDGVMQEVFARVPRETIYEATGIQFLPFNTVFQLVAASARTPAALDSASRFATIPDIFNYWLTGELRCEYTNATTTQMVDARTRTWACDLLKAVGVPTRLLPPIAEPGATLGRVTRSASRGLENTPVVLPACHDTGSAVAAVPANGRRAFLSSGTWSLLGIEMPRPVITHEALDANLTNEGGVCGTTRLLKNIGGLWLLQCCRRDWSRAGRAYEYDELIALAAEERHAFASLFDPDDPAFLHPDDMPSAIAEYCRRTGQAVPDAPAAYARGILESLAYKYRVVVDALESIAATRIAEIQIVGGGSRNRLLNQFTADATGRTVIAGPVEATALGNIAMQMLATGAVSSLARARAIIEDSFPAERFEPRAADLWDAHYARFNAYCNGTRG